MPKLKSETQAQRRAHILDAAERCFVRSGFHATTIEDICREAKVSSGALYVYFKAKEELIAGLCARDREQLGHQFAHIAAEPDLVEALERLARHYTVTEPRAKQRLYIEAGVEASRNPQIAALTASMDEFVREGFTALIERATAQGRINPTLPPSTLAQMICVIGDGLFWRRATDEAFDANAMLPGVRHVFQLLLNPTDLKPIKVTS